MNVMSLVFASSYYIFSIGLYFIRLRDQPHFPPKGKILARYEVDKFKDSCVQGLQAYISDLW
jgi:hypothetical protein